MPLLDYILEKAVDIASDALTGTSKPSYFDNGWNTLLSSNVNAFMYTSSTRQLSIEFKGGRQYDYYNIAPDTVTELATTSSPGAWVNNNLRDAPARRA